jgi:hypothetical protein
MRFDETIDEIRRNGMTQDTYASIHGYCVDVRKIASPDTAGKGAPNGRTWSS